MAEGKITWRSFWNGPNTIYVLDHQGVISFKGVRDKEMDKAVDQLLKTLADQGK